MKRYRCVCDECGTSGSSRDTYHSAWEDGRRHDCAQRTWPTPRVARGLRCDTDFTGDPNLLMDIARRATAVYLRTNRWILRFAARDDLVSVAAEYVARGLATYDPARGTEREGFLFNRAMFGLRDHAREVGPLSRRQVDRQINLDDLPQWQRPPCNIEALPFEGYELVEPQGERPIALAELRADMDEMLATLPDAERTVIVEYFFADRSLREIADRLGVTESRICQIKAAALSRLRPAALSLVS